jgi:hypothetical protein
VRRKPAPSHRPVKRNPPAAMVVSAPPPKPWLLSQDEVTILKNAICRGASDQEMQYCLAVARRYELDPFQQQVWFIPRWDSQAEQTDGKKGARVYVPVVGINGMLHIAARDHADFGTYSEPEYGPMISVTWKDRTGKAQTFKAPEWARIECHKKGLAQPTVAKVFWEEIYPNVDHSPLVRQMPRLMLAKCAKAQATRTAYPKTGGLLIPEETHSREFTDITPGGRLISRPSPDGEVGTAKAAGAMLEKKLAEYKAKEPTPQAAKPQQRQEFVIIQPITGNPEMLAVSGSGLSIVKAELGTINFMVFLQNAKTEAIPVSAVDEFTVMCKRFGVDAVMKQQPKVPPPAGATEQRKTVSDRVASQPQTTGTGPQTPAPGPMEPPKAVLPKDINKKAAPIPEQKPAAQDDEQRIRGKIDIIYTRDKDRKPLKTTRGSPFVKVVVGGVMFCLFDNAERSVFIEGKEDKLRLFGILAEAKPGEPIEFTYTEKTSDRGVMRNISNILRVGQFEWEASGLPVSRRQESMW